MADGTLTGALVGGGLAIVAGVTVQWTANWLSYCRERRAIARSLAGEISAIVRIAELRGFLQQGQAMLDRITRQQKPEVLKVHVHQDYFAVFHGSASKLGLLPPDLAEQVPTFYTMVKSLIEDVTNDNLHLQSAEEASSFLAEQIQIFKELLQNGPKLVAGLRSI